MGLLSALQYAQLWVWAIVLGVVWRQQKPDYLLCAGFRQMPFTVSMGLLSFGCLAAVFLLIVKSLKELPNGIHPAISTLDCGGEGGSERG